MNKKTIKVLVPAGALGIPLDKNALINGIKQKPDLIAIDGGSTDSGPYYLGSGKSKYSYSATKRDWSILMEMRAKAKVPLLIGTAGTCGTKTSVEWMLKITKEIAKENKEKLKIVTLKSVFQLFIIFKNRGLQKFNYVYNYTQHLKNYE